MAVTTPPRIPPRPDAEPQLPAGPVVRVLSFVVAAAVLAIGFGFGALAVTGIFFGDGMGAVAGIAMIVPALIVGVMGLGLFAARRRHPHVAGALGTVVLVFFVLAVGSIVNEGLAQQETNDRADVEAEGQWTSLRPRIEALGWVCADGVSRFPLYDSSLRSATCERPGSDPKPLLIRAEMGTATDVANRVEQMCTGFAWVAYEPGQTWAIFHGGFLGEYSVDEAEAIERSLATELGSSFVEC